MHTRADLRLALHLIHYFFFSDAFSENGKSVYWSLMELVHISDLYFYGASTKKKSSGQIWGDVKNVIDNKKDIFCNTLNAWFSEV